MEIRTNNLVLSTNVVNFPRAMSAGWTAAIGIRAVVFLYESQCTSLTDSLSLRNIANENAKINNNWMRTKESR